jgi:hypothetical protein
MAEKPSDKRHSVPYIVCMPMQCGVSVYCARRSFPGKGFRKLIVENTLKYKLKGDLAEDCLQTTERFVITK